MKHVIWLLVVIVALSVKGRNGWEEKDPSRWIRVDGKWYVSLGSN